MGTVTRAALLIIGDEILKGSTVDTNSPFTAKILYSLGIKLSRIVTIGDDVTEIVREVRDLSGKYDLVITSGGIGPTHDDITYEAIAQAFNMKLTLNPEIQGLIQMYSPGSNDVTVNPEIKMAYIPEKHELLYASDKAVNKLNTWSPTLLPIVKVQNVYIFPGLPICFEECLMGLRQSFPLNIGSFFTETLYLKLHENKIAELLKETIGKFDVVIGCYPIETNAKYSTKLTVEATSLNVLSDAVSFLKSKIDDQYWVDLTPKDPIVAIMQQVNLLLCCPSVQKAVTVIEECLRKYKMDQICISFNGGKDCTALLHLTHAVMKSQGRSCPLQALYVKSTQPFPQVREFVREASQRYTLDLIEYEMTVKDAVVQLLTDRPNIKAVLMGNRKSDPYCGHLQDFQRTDEGWPELMRVFPLLEWSYRDVWQALLALRVPYCCLYDQGYTSLGDQGNTFRNPALIRRDAETGKCTYLPAYKLTNQAAERAGRNKPLTFKF